MASPQLFVFGDQTISFDKELQKILHTKDNDTLTSLLDRVCFALRHELGSLPFSQQALFPRFTTLIDLASKIEDTEGSPALKFAFLVLCELGQFVNYYGQSAKAYPETRDSYALGLCAGSFAAAAISSARTLPELIPAGVEAVLVAFRTALRSLITRNDIEGANTTGFKSWSIIIGLQEAEARAALDSFSSAKSLSPSSRPYLSATTASSVTISGPPSVLETFLGTIQKKSTLLPIELPYHAPHLFGSVDTNQIVGKFHDSVLESYEPRIPMLSASSGQVISATDFKSLLEQVVWDTLVEPLRWPKVLQSLVNEFSAKEKVAIHPVLSNAGQFLAKELSRDTQANVVCEPFENVKLFNAPTGKFEHSKIAIVGYSGRFPESASNEEFWDLLTAGRDVHKEIPADRFDWKAHFDPTGKKKNTSKVQYGCFIKEPGVFDTRFFNMSPRESENADPAQRLAITSVYEAMEMAGLVPNKTPSTQQDRIGVFYGVTSDDWREVNSGQNIDTYFIPGGNRAFIPGRISYFFRFSGPSISMDTACSSSFAAIQTGCAYLWRGECDTVVAGGVNVLTNPDNFAGLDRGHFLSSTGNCNAFDDGASGYCRADAVGSVILKRLEDAIADGDPIQGVIVGSNTNHCGQTESITRPHEGDQVSVFKRVMRHAGVNPKDISYIEMHGTGTQAGDATEMRSVLNVFAPDQTRAVKQPLYLGSVKANVGHAESASGVTSLIKVLMMMKHSQIPPHCGIKTKINHNYPLDLKDRNVHIAFKNTSWRREDTASGKRSVFLNNFSAAGGNTAVLLEDAPLPGPDVEELDPRTNHVISITAKTAKALEGNISTMIAYLEANPKVSLAQLAYTTTARRMQHNYRALVSGPDTSSIREALKKKLGRTDVKPIPNAAKLPGVAFVFTGQGALYTSLAKELFQSVSGFRADLIRFDGIAQRQGFPSFLSMIDGTCTKVDEVEPVVAHLSLTCVQMALTNLWKAWGIRAKAAIGHSLGEYAALHAAGVLTASDAIYLVGARAQLLSQHCKKGTHGMLAIKASVEAIQPVLEGTSCEFACYNQQTSNVVSGLSEELDKLTDRCKERGLETIRLDMEFAFHSAQVEPILKAFEAVASSVSFRAPAIPYFSPLLQQVVSDDKTINAAYLANACRNLVNFQGALDSARTTGAVNEKTIWLEIGAHPMCSGMVKGTLGSQTLTVASLRKGTDTWKVLCSGLELLATQGLDIEWTEYHRDFKAAQKVLVLPRYSWDLKNYWIPYRNNFCLLKGEGLVPAGSIAAAATAASLAEAAPVPTRAPLYLSPAVQSVLEEEVGDKISTMLMETNTHDPRVRTVIEQHQVNGAQMCPSTLYADMAFTMAKHLLKINDLDVNNTGIDVGSMVVNKPLLLNVDGPAQLIRASASFDKIANSIAFAFYSVNAGGAKTIDHAVCTVKLFENQNWSREFNRNAFLIKSRITALKRAAEEGTANKLTRGLAYKLFSALVSYGPKYQGMQDVWLDSDQLEATANVRFQVDDEGFVLNTRWSDNLGHLAGFIMNGNDNTHSSEQIFVNHGWERMRFAKHPAYGKTYQVYNRMQLLEGTTYSGDTYILDEGEVVALFEGVKFQGVPRRVLDVFLPPSKRATAASKTAPAPVRKAAPTASLAPAVKQPIKKTAAPSPAKKEAKSSRVSPKGSSVGKIMSIISDEAGIDLADLTPESDFADFGIDSLLSLTICGRLTEELGINVPSTAFAEYPTVKELTGFLQASLGSAATPEEETAIEAPVPRASSDDSSSDADLSDAETEASSAPSVGATADDSKDIIKAIRSVIIEEVGLAEDDLTSSTCFSEVGIDSLLSMTVVGRLNEELGTEFAPTMLLDVENLDGIVASLGLPSTSSPAPTVKSSSSRARAIDIGAFPRASSILLQGSPNASKKLWLFPDGSGSATSYASLGKIADDVAIYGLNCPWMKQPENLKCSMEEMVAVFVAEMRRRQPHGPYYLGGWSAGGICAYEAAQQLSAAGEEVARLLLIDSPNPIGLENPPQRMYDFFDSLNIFGTNGKKPPTWLRPHFDAFLTVLDNYKIQPKQGAALPTHMVYARDGICKHPGDPRPETRPDDPREMLWLLNNRTQFDGAGWNDLVGSANINVQVLDEVNHFTLVAPGPKMDNLVAFVRGSMG